MTVRARISREIGTGWPANVGRVPPGGVLRAAALLDVSAAHSLGTARGSGPALRQAVARLQASAGNGAVTQLLAAGLGFMYGWVLGNYVDLVRAGFGNVKERARLGLPLSWKQQQELLDSEKRAAARESLKRHYESIAGERGISVEEAEKQELAKQASTRHLVRKEMTIGPAP